jgi:hypothetical protein
MIATALSMKQLTVYDQIKDHLIIRNVEEFCTQCQEATQSVRLNNLNVMTLTSIVGGLWYATNGRELMGVALEHPPTWLMLVERALSDRSYNSSGLGEFLGRGVFKRLSENYRAQINLLVQRSL